MRDFVSEFLPGPNAVPLWVVSALDGMGCFIPSHSLPHGLHRPRVPGFPCYLSTVNWVTINVPVLTAVVFK